MVYTAINENCINPDDNTCVKEVLNIIDAIYGQKIEIKKCQILDAVKDLKGSYLVNIPNQRSYKLHHPTLQESVILSFAQIDEDNIDKIIPLISWSFFLKMVKPESYKEKEGEVVLRFPTNSYKLLADRLVEFYKAGVEFMNISCFIQNLCIWKAYEVFNIPVLEFLLSKYNQTPFDINLFFKMIYSDKWIQRYLGKETVLGLPSLLFEPLKWMIETFKDQELNDPNFILRTACKYQMFDTVEYLASRCKTFDKVSCLQAFVDKPKSLGSGFPLNQDLFNFLKPIDTTSKELIPIVMSIIQKHDIPDYMSDAFLPVCINNTDILTLACQHGQVYLIKLIIESSNLAHLDIQAALVALSSIWHRTEDKEVLHMEEIVNTAYERKCFELLMWIHENCHPHVSIDPKKVLLLACADYRVDVAKRVLQTFEQTSLDIDGGTLFMITCSKQNNFRSDFFMLTSKEMLKGSDVISGVIKLISVNIKIRNDLNTFVLSLLEQYLSCLKTEDIKEMINKSLEQKYYILVNWFLTKRSSFSFDKQTILNKACADGEIETIKILSKDLYALDMNKSMINACTSAAPGFFWTF
ncbi:unnamed protein product [Mytilus edulis]|uniref:Uncharacterized protein n=1 Tax=Mytilus edulis TaxID=6550 RepID=A0A8S3PUG3_MYTED|nr:unnamed protein product [Mytilus edulis]